MAPTAKPPTAPPRLDATEVLVPSTPEAAMSSAPPEFAPADRDPDAEDLPRAIGGHPVVAELGRGAMGVVYLAYEPSLERHVALKTLGSVDRETPAVRLLMHEAQTAGRLFHKGIVPIHRIGFDAEHGAYYTMRHVDGRTFGEILDGLRDEDLALVEAFPRRRLTRLFAEICRAVGHAHEQGVLHRDLKPANLIVTRQGEALVLDWGLACRTEAIATAGRGGTLGYLAPECLRGDDHYGPASDVYSLGAILHEILTLHRPIEATTGAEVVDRTLRGDLDPIDRAQVWAPLVPVLSRCLAMDPGERFDDATSMADALEDVLDGRSPLTEAARLRVQDTSLDDVGFAADGVVARNRTDWIVGVDSGLHTRDAVRGDWRLDLECVAPRDMRSWTMDIDMVPDTEDAAPHLTLRLRRDERVTLSLLRRERLIGRSLNVRLVQGRIFRLEFGVEGSRVVVSLDGQKLMDVHEPFPSARSHLQLHARREPFALRDLRLSARGAPLYLSFLSLPDQLVHQRRFEQARDLYLEFHRAHHERTEGQAALFKAALCATELGDLAQAVGRFCELEGGPLDHACALGLAQVGLVDGNLEWGNTALIDAYQRHRDRRVRRELWFALLTLLERMPTARIDDVIDRGCLLLDQLEPARDDAEQITLLLLDRARSEEGSSGMRRVAMRLVEEFPGQPGVVEEALITLHYAGLDEMALSLVQNAIERAIERASSPERLVRLLLMAAESALAHEEFERAHGLLAEARSTVDVDHPDHSWALGWTSLAHWLDDDPGAVLSLGVEIEGPRGDAQSGHFGILQALAHAARGDEPAARARLEDVRVADHLWGRTATAMLEGVTIDQVGTFTHHYPRRLITEAVFYLAEFERVTGAGDHADQLFGVLADGESERALFRRVSHARRAAALT